MITRSRARQLSLQKTEEGNLNDMIHMGLKYEEVQRVRKQNKWFSWTKFLLSTTAFLAACFASMKVAQQSGTNLLGSVYDFTERAKESFLTIPYKVPGYSFLFGQDLWSTPSMPWIILESSLSSTHLFYEPNSTIHQTLKEKQAEYDVLTENIYKILVQKTNYETTLLNSRNFLETLPEVRDLQASFFQKKKQLTTQEQALCTINPLNLSRRCHKKEMDYEDTKRQYDELRLLRSYTLDPLLFPTLFFSNSSFLRQFPRLPINASTFQTLLFERDTLLTRSSFFHYDHLLNIAPRYVTTPYSSNSTILQHVLNSLISPLLQAFDRVLSIQYKQQSNLHSQIEILQNAYSANMVDKQYETAIKDWDAFAFHCSQNPTSICFITTPLNRVRVVDIVYELRTNGLPIPENFVILLQKVFLSPDRFQNATARDLSRVLRVEKYKKNPDPYTLMLSGSLGFLFFSGTYYVFFDRVSTILYAITIPFDMIIAWGESWIQRRAFATEQFLQLPDNSLVPAERSELVLKNTHKA